MNKQNISQIELVRILRSAILSGNLSEDSLDGIKMISSYGSSVLGFACRFGTLDDVKLLVQAGFKFSSNYLNAGLVDGDLVCLLDANTPVCSLCDYRYYALLPSVAFFNMYKVSTHEVREEILDYLLSVQTIVYFDPAYLLLSSIIFGDFKTYDFLKSKGIVATHNALLFLGRLMRCSVFTIFTENLLDTEFYQIFSRIEKEVCASKKRERLICSMEFMIYNEDRFGTPDGFKIFINCLSIKGVSKKAIIEYIIKHNRLDLLEVIADCGWLKNRLLREDVMNLDCLKRNMELMAWLLNYINCNIDIEAERKKAERAEIRALNANPNSLGALRKTWSFEKLNENNIMITSYKGNSTNITVPDHIGKYTVTEIGRNFLNVRNCSNRRHFVSSVTSISLPKTLETIHEHAFYDCKSLEAIDIPESVRKISDFAFCNCEKLTSVTLPKSLESLGAFVFNECHSLETLNIPGSVKDVNCLEHALNCLSELILNEGTETLTIDIYHNIHSFDIYLPHSFKRIIYNQSDFSYDEFSNFTIHVYKDTEAEKFCINNKFSYVIREE